jgi:flagellar FliJ protein
MKRFRFELEQLLRLKMWKEEEAKKALAEEVAALERLKARLAELKGELSGVIAHPDAAGREGALMDVPLRIGILQYSSHLGGLIMNQQGDIAAQGERLKEKSDALLKAMQERKVLEKLKERRKEEHGKQALKLAYANLDEASASLLRRAAENRAAAAGAEDLEAASEDPSTVGQTLP